MHGFSAFPPPSREELGCGGEQLKMEQVGSCGFCVNGAQVGPRGNEWVHCLCQGAGAVPGFWSRVGGRVIPLIIFWEAPNI